MRRFLPLLSLAVLTPLLAPTACSSDTAPAAEDAAVDTLADIAPYEEPVFDSDDPAGRVLVLPLYDPAKRCLIDPTEIGQFDTGEDGKIAPCAPMEVCYVRPDGVLAYHDQDCVHGTNFRANWKRMEYSDLGPCEPIKRVRDLMKQCPNSSCTYARDVTIDTARTCATAITSKGCRETYGAPTACFCDGAGNALVAADPKATTTPPMGFTACDATNDACKKALAVVDTVKGCEATAADAGSDGG